MFANLVEEKSHATAATEITERELTIKLKNCFKSYTEK